MVEFDDGDYTDWAADAPDAPAVVLICCESLRHVSGKPESFNNF